MKLIIRLECICTDTPRFQGRDNERLIACYYNSRFIISSVLSLLLSFYDRKCPKYYEPKSIEKNIMKALQSIITFRTKSLN